jgi:hypothetical protein
MDITGYLLRLLQGGLGNPALPRRPCPFVCLVRVLYRWGHDGIDPKESVTAFLGRNAQRCVSIPRPHWPARCYRSAHARSCRYSRVSTGRARDSVQDHFPVLRAGSQYSGACLYRRGHRSRPCLCPSLPFTRLRHRDRHDHGPYLPPCRYGSRRKHGRALCR